MTTQELETFKGSGSPRYVDEIGDVIRINNVVSSLLLGDPDNFRADVRKYAAGVISFEDLHTRAIDCNVWDDQLDRIISETEAEFIRDFFLDHLLPFEDE